LREKQGDFDNAERLLSESIEIKSRIYGVGHLDTITSENSLAGIYESKGDVLKEYTP
jgi:hypothetical protein